MRFRSIPFLLACGTGAALAVPAWSQTSTAPATTASVGAAPAGALSADTIQAINIAMIKVDVPTLTTLSQPPSDPLIQQIAAMALDRVHADFEASSAKARACENSQFDHQPQVALYCAMFAIGNLRLAGEPLEAEQADKELVQRFNGKLPAAQYAGISAYADAHDNQPVMQVQLPTGGFTIPVNYSKKRKHHAAAVDGPENSIDVQANGKPTTLHVGTNNSFIMLDEDTAKDLGVRIIGQSAKTKDAQGADMTMQFGVLDKLEFSGVTVTNAPVEIVPAKEHSIGLGILKYLHAFRVMKDGIQVYGPADARPVCTPPMLVASDINGANSMRVVTELTIDGKPRIVVLNSASEFYLRGNEGALQQADSRFDGHMRTHGMGGERHEQAFSRSKVDVVVDGKTIHMEYAVFHDTHTPWDYVLGRDALEDMDFYVDFDNRHSCLLLHDDLH